MTPVLIPVLWALAGLGLCIWLMRHAFAAHRLGHDGSLVSAGRAEGTVLVTGATGFIGRRLMAALLAQGRRVIVLTRDRRGARAQFGPAPLVVENLDELPSEIRLDAMVNLAGARLAGGLWTKSRRRVLLASRVETTRRLAAFAARLERPPKVLVNGSGAGFYGDGGQMLLEEEMEAGPGFMGELCTAWEAAACELEGLGVRVCRLRLGLVLDWSGGVLPMLSLLARFGFGTRIGKGDQWAPWIHRDDAVRMILAAINDPRWDGPINAVAPGMVTQGEMTRRIAAHFGRKQWVAVPAGPMRLALGEFSDLFLASQRVLPKRAFDLGFVFTRPTLEAAFAPVEAPLRLPAVAVGGAAPIPRGAVAAG